MEFFNEKGLSKLLEEGVLIDDISTVKISVNAKIESGAKLHSFVEIIEESTIESGAEIFSFSSIINSCIKKNSKIIQSYIENSIVGENCLVGPFAHIKQNSILKDNIRIGNFVEIKNSIIGSNTKSAHLTYIGDATVGERVNFGCGVVIANYDGKVKHKTQIGNDVFIGCNCNLIAPIIIEDNCFIAAGTTVTKNLTKNTFCIGRAKEEIKAKKS